MISQGNASTMANKKTSKTKNTKQQLLNHTKLAIGITTALIGGYAGRVHAGTCTSPSPSVCSGATNSGADVTQSPLAASTGMGAPASLTVTTNAGFGINTAANGGSAINLSVPKGGSFISFNDYSNQSPITGLTEAITAYNAGTGAITITTSGVVSSSNSHGINAVNGLSSKGTITINTSGNITSKGGGGIYTDSNGSGAISITTAVNTTVKGGANQYAIVANSDSGAITINSDSSIVGGIYAFIDNPNASGSSSLIITTNGSITTTTGQYGINAFIGGGNYTNNTTVTANASISSSKGGGITAGTYKGDVNVTTSSTVQANSYGIGAFIYQDGNIAITVGGDITATKGDGIYANRNSNYIGTVTITGNGNITGGTGTGNDGIEVDGSNDVSVGVNGVISGDPGINVTSANGPIIIGGAGNVNSNPGDGISTQITSNGAAGNIIIERNGEIHAKGAGRGIYANNSGKGDNIIKVTKLVDPDTGIGIESNTTSGGSFITLNSGADVIGGILNNAGDSIITVYSGASLSGSITLGDGSDTLTFSGGDFTGVTAFDGGDDVATADGFTDELVFNGSSGAIDAAIVTNWERIVLDSGSSIDFSNGATKTLTTGVLDNLGGTVNMVNAAPTDQLTVTGDYGGGGNLALEAELNAGGTSDTLIINGDVSGTTIITISDLGDGSGSATVGDGILLVQVTGASPADAFTLAGEVRAGDYLYDLVQVGNNWYLQSQLSPLPATPQNIPTLSEWGQILLVSLLGLFGLFGTKRRKKTNQI